jgi:integrase/recombinase XerC
MNQVVPFIGPASPALIAAAGDHAGVRFIEFFTANIRNPHTRRAYARAVAEFLAWCESAGVPSIAAVQPVHVASYIEWLGRRDDDPVSAPTIKLQLAAIRQLFDWLVVGQVMPMNPAASVRGPKHVVKRGKTTVLAAAEARRCSTASM